MQDPDQSLRALLRHFRVRAGLSQEALAERAGVSVDAVGTIERGTRRAPYRMTVDALADALGLTEDDRLLFDHAATRSRRLLLAKSGRTPTGPPIDAPRDDSSQRAGAASTRPHNLPLPRDGIVGRNEVIADVVRLIADHRLVSLLGSGGVGKTTVAVAAAAATLQHWRDGAWFVDLTQSTDGTTVPRVIAAALHIGSADDASTSEALVDRLLERRMLLVLDNCEHAIAQVAGISEDIRRACPHVHILATSRETLNVANEIVYRVPSLDVPPPDGDDSVSDASRYASVQLFVDRVRAADNRFTLHDGHVSDVVAICRHLDGIALALELAAARVHVLGVAGVRRGLSTTVDILSTSNRGRSQRQKTVRATIEWSYNLLSESERTFLMRLATFQDGWTLEAAEAVCLDDREYRTSGLELLSSLVDKSLVATRHRHAALFLAPDRARTHGRETRRGAGGRRNSRGPSSLLLGRRGGQSPRPVRTGAGRRTAAN